MNKSFCCIVLLAAILSSCGGKKAKPDPLYSDYYYDDYSTNVVEVPFKKLSGVRTIQVKINDCAEFPMIFLALFLDRKVSAAPEIVPDRPALLPDWSITMAIIARERTTCRMVIARFIDHRSFQSPVGEKSQFRPGNRTHVKGYHKFYRNASLFGEKSGEKSLNRPHPQEIVVSRGQNHKMIRP